MARKESIQRLIAAGCTTTEFGERMFGFQMPNVCVIRGPIIDGRLPEPMPEDIDLYIVTGPLTPLVAGTLALARLDAPVLLCPDDGLAENDPEFPATTELLRSSEVFASNSIGCLEVCGIQFHAAQSDKSANLSHPANDVAASSRASSTRRTRRHSTAIIEQEVSPWLPHAVLSRKPLDKTEADPVQRVKDRLLAIGSALRHPGTEAPKEDPLPWICIHDCGGDVISTCANPLSGATEMSLFEHKLRPLPNALQTATAATVSLFDPLFSIASEHTLFPHRHIQPDVPYLSKEFALWCAGVVAGGDVLTQTGRRYAIEAFPLDRLTGRSRIYIGLMVEGLLSTEIPELKKKLAARFRDPNASAIVFDLIPVNDLEGAKELVPHLSRDAMDLAFEATRH
ncbi:hypothetical protein [Paraburkholderia flagellata]|uniref:hypothetical protein n=1 Tax=Paraburkholderia flagellata TaxID=2883241 RepID=UPI001F1620B5|nr:hypothetical protein [Paraburkholderia flagellata]